MSSTEMRKVTWEEAVDNGDIELLLDDWRGIYLPKHFAEEFGGRLLVDGVDAQEINTMLKVLETGPDYDANPNYWDVWGDVVDNGIILDPAGNRWRLYQDGALFAIREDVEVDWGAM